jgi:hypothetical protein
MVQYYYEVDYTCFRRSTSWIQTSTLHRTVNFLWRGKNTGIWNFMDRLDIRSTYLPLFPPMKGEVLKEFSDRQKATIFYDALPHYYIKK